MATRLGVETRAAATMIQKIMYEELERYFALIRPYKGVDACLDALASAGLRLAALSDFPASRKLAHLGLENRFELELCSEDTGRLKPAPEPFRALSEGLGLEPRDILYIGNSPRFDVAGAKGAEMPCALRGRRRTAADFRFTDFSALTDFALALA